MFSITIQIANLEELESFIATLKHSAPSRLTADVIRAADAQIPPQIGAQTAPPADKPKRGPGRPRKAAEPEKEAAEPAPEPTGAATVSVDDARAALQELVTTKGMDVAFGVLKQYGAQRVSELQAADYAGFIDACKAA